MSAQEKKVILLVEDDFFVEAVEKEQITHLGYEVISVNTGEMAVELALNDERINLILMDINLGQEMDGLEAARQIVDRKNMPIIFLRPTRKMNILTN